MSTYHINGPVLTIPDPEAFGFDGNEIAEDHPYNPKDHPFKIVTSYFVHIYENYHAHNLVIEHVESGRFFARGYTMHSENGFEWGPGWGKDCSTTWHEVFPHQVTTTVYR